MARFCVRPDCSSEAAATMSYDYASRTVWVDDLTAESAPSGYDLCAAHADGLRVPQGWSRTERRVTVTPLFERRAG
jgi:hypothetical protein